MTNLDDVAFMDATAQAELVRSKEVKPIELVEGAIRRIEDLNPTLNAVIHKLYEDARETAEGDIPEGPFTGVPFLLKDLLAAYAGAPLTNGCAFLKSFVPDHDSELVARFKRSGLIILGKTNTPEFGLTVTTEPDALRPDPEPLGPGPDDRRLQWRFGCGGGHGTGRHGPRQRWRRVDQDTGILLRGVWSQAHPSSEPLGPGLRRRYHGTDKRARGQPFGEG